MYFLKKKTFVLLFFVIILIESLSLLYFVGINFYQSFLASINPDFLVDLANKDRQELKAGQLEISPVLVEAATLKAEDMAENGYFAHTSPDGVTPWYWFKEVGYDYTYAGENLAVNFSDSEKLHQAWLDSLSHRENIINSNFTEIGIATAKGEYKGKEAVFVVQLFGRPRIAVVQADKENIKPIEVPQVVREEKKELEPNEESFVAVAKSEEDATPTLVSSALTQREEIKYTPLISRFRFDIWQYLVIGLLFVLAVALFLKLLLKKSIKLQETLANAVLILFIIIITLSFNAFLFSIIKI